MTYDPATDRSMCGAINRLLKAEEACLDADATVFGLSSDQRREIIAERQRAETCLLRLIGKRVNKGGR